MQPIVSFGHKIVNNFRLVIVLKQDKFKKNHAILESALDGLTKTITCNMRFQIVDEIVMSGATEADETDTKTTFELR